MMLGSLCAETIKPVSVYDILVTYQVYMMILFWGIRSGVFSSRPHYGMLGTGISGSNSFVRAPSSGGGSNAPLPALSVPHLDPNAD